jgi:hypothetical protein
MLTSRKYRHVNFLLAAEAELPPFNVQKQKVFSYAKPPLKHSLLKTLFFDFFLDLFLLTKMFDCLAVASASTSSFFVDYVFIRIFIHFFLLLFT